MFHCVSNMTYPLLTAATKMVRLPDMYMIDVDTVQQMKTPQNMELPLR
jgi:hypothetical protein